jgi:hypothetical protein
MDTVNLHLTIEVTVVATAAIAQEGKETKSKLTT